MNSKLFFWFFINDFIHQRFFRPFIVVFRFACKCGIEHIFRCNLGNIDFSPSPWAARFLVLALSKHFQNRSMNSIPSYFSFYALQFRASDYILSSYTRRSCQSNLERLKYIEWNSPEEINFLTYSFPSFVKKIWIIWK